MAFFFLSYTIRLIHRKLRRETASVMVYSPNPSRTFRTITGATNLLPRGGTYTAVARPKGAWMANM